LLRTRPLYWLAHPKYIRPIRHLLLLASGFWVASNIMPVPLIDFRWYHAVNDQHKLDNVLASSAKHTQLHAIEADIIYSEAKGQSVMGHPPQVDGELTLALLLQQLNEANFQSTSMTDTDANILKLDFKSMKALQASINDVENYLKDLPHQLHQHVWINADILAGPGGKGEDMQPKFDSVEFMELLTSETSLMKSITLSIGWTTSLTDIHAPYTMDMIDEMLTLLRSYPCKNITFPIRATSVLTSWEALRKLYDNNVDENKRWTLTLWWSLTSEQHKMTKDAMNRIHSLLESDYQSILPNRTFYDLVNFSPP
ncbi:FAM151 family protein, partial [Skeletonema marinoi]